MPPSCPRLTIVIPALNEEESIAATIERCLAAAPQIEREGQVSAVEIVVVNDGSTDQTSSIAHDLARRDERLQVIDFKVNRGYGAAIKTGIHQGTGELVAFLDADGTCDPQYFAEMCRLVQQDGTAIVLGSRLGPGSSMPVLRRVGNRIFAVLLSMLSGQSVTDTASGMRVIRREALSSLYPLPDGLQFTPAMSARATFAHLRVVEVEMPYAERQGESKLHVLKDGMRFLVAIFDALMVFRPNRLFNLAAAICLIVAVGWGLYPMEYYLREAQLLDWMIYRVLLCSFLGSCAFAFLASGVVADQILSLVYHRRSRSFFDDALAWLFSPRLLIATTLTTGLIAVAVVWPGLVDYVTTGKTTLHWSRAIVAVFLLHIATWALVSSILQWTVRLWREERGSGGA